MNKVATILRNGRQPFALRRSVVAPLRERLVASIVRHIAASLALRSGSRLRRSSLAPARPAAFGALRGKNHFDRLMLNSGYRTSTPRRKMRWLPRIGWMCQPSNAYCLFALTPLVLNFLQRHPPQERMSTYVQGSLFEKAYLLRALGAIAHERDIALTELVANCWDAGAASVHITDLDSIGGDLRVRDDVVGMPTDKFTRRWMKLGYGARSNRANRPTSRRSAPAGNAWPTGEMVSVATG